MITQPYPSFIDPEVGGRAKPVSNGTIFIGQNQKDAIQFPEKVYYTDSNGTEIEMAQPIYLNSAGVTVDSKNSSTVVRPYTKSASYSILIRNSRGNDRYINDSVSGYATKSWVEGRAQISVDSFDDIKSQNINAGSAIKTTGYYLPGDGGGDTYITYNKNDTVSGYGVTAEALLKSDCAGVLEMDNSLVAVRQYNVNIDVRQMGFKPCETEYISDRIGWIPENGAFDNASLFQKYDNLINKMTANVTTFSGTFAAGFTGYSSVRGDNNTCCRYSAKYGKLIGTVEPALIALPLADAIVIRTPINSDPDYTSKIEYLELDNFKVCGNWSQQTWAGPTGKEDDGIYDQNGFSTINIKRLITKNSGVSHCAQDGMPSGSVEYFHHTNLKCRWTGKGCNSNFNFVHGVYVDPVHELANESPSDDKALYTLSGDGYSAIGTQNIDETITSDGKLYIHRPRGNQENGRWGLFSVIQGTINPNIYIYQPDVTAKGRNILTTSFRANSGGRLEIHGGDIYKDGNGRSMSIVNTAFVAFRDKPYLHIKNNNDGRIDISGTTSTVEGSFRENGAAINSILMTDVQRINLFDLSCRSVGMIDCQEANIHDSEITTPLQDTGVTEWSFYNNRGADHPEKRPNELRANVVKSSISIPAGGSTDIVFVVTGAKPGDFVDAVSATSSATEELVASAGRVTENDKVTIRLFNTTGDSILIGSNVWSVVVRKRNLVV